MKLAILGNGKSRDLYKETDYDIVLGCNLPPENIKITYTCLVDAKAGMLAYRSNADHYHRLKEYQLVIGPRCAHGMTKCKSEPAGTTTVYQHLKENDHIYKEMKLFEDAVEIGQRYFSAGHLAFVFANDEWPNSDIHMYGFDSFFTGTQVSYTDKLRNSDVTQIKRNRNKYNKDNPVNTVGSWYWLWEKVFVSDRNNATSINIHGFKGDDIPDTFKKYCEVITHDILSTE